MNMTHNCTELHDDAVLELLAEKQDYLDYIDADMEAFYSIKADALGIA